jgi:hypothetical protein
MLADWDAAYGAERTKLLASLFEQIEVPEVPAVKFRTKGEAETGARLLADRGHDTEWVRHNGGAQRELTWNIRLVDGSEIHNHAQLAELGLVVPGANRPAVRGLKVVAVPREGWRRFFEYVVLERETGFSRASGT